MNKYYLPECRKHIRIGDGFADNNYFLIDGNISDLPAIKLSRHGDQKESISDCCFQFSATVKGSFSIWVAHDGSQVTVGPNTRCNIDMRLWRSPKVTIGAFTTINMCRMICDRSEIEIGEDCMLSDEILLQSNDQHGLIDLNSKKFLNEYRRKIIIERHVWIGRRATITPDTVLGKGSVLGTGSLLTKNADPFSYYVGVPAKKIRSNASWTRQPGQISQIEQEFFDAMGLMEID